MKQVTIINRVVTQYRLPFFLQLDEALRQDGIRLRVVYSDPAPHENLSNDKVDLPSRFASKVHAHWFLRRFLYQHAPREIAAADLVICEQANKYLISYPLVMLSALGAKRFAYWGLGENKQSDATAFSEWLKRVLANKVTWWFAYTQGTVEYLASNKVSPKRITVVQNAVDTRRLRAALASIRDADLQRVRTSLGIPPNARTALCVGVLEPFKRLDLVLAAAALVRERIPGFHLVIAGAGSEEDKIRAAAATTSWIHYVGPIFGREKALFCKLSDICLLPGRVGLAVVDAFGGGLPVVATQLPNHGPEIEYLQHGVNGLITDHNAEAYADAAISVLSCAGKLQALRQGAARSANEYSIETMVQRFREGVHGALAVPVLTDRDGLNVLGSSESRG